MAQQCQMIIGFLVPRACGHRAVGQCTRCSRYFCQEHLSLQHGGVVCLACEQGLEQPILVSGKAGAFDAADLAAFSQVDDLLDDGDLFADLS